MVNVNVFVQATDVDTDTYADVMAITLARRTYSSRLVNEVKMQEKKDTDAGARPQQ